MIKAVFGMAMFTLAASVAPAVYAQAVTVEGQVQKVDPAAEKITLKHGPIKNLDMDAMTMVFRVKDPAMLKDLKPGDRVRFQADRVNGQITVIQMEKAK